MPCLHYLSGSWLFPFQGLRKTQLCFNILPSSNSELALEAYPPSLHDFGFSSPHLYVQEGLSCLPKNTRWLRSDPACPLLIPHLYFSENAPRFPKSGGVDGVQTQMTRNKTGSWGVMKCDLLFPHSLLLAFRRLSFLKSQKKKLLRLPRITTY